MSEPRRDRVMPFLLATALIAGALTIDTIVNRRRPAAAAPAPAPAAPASDAMARFRACRPYHQYQADTRTPAVSDAKLVEEAACLCSLASAFSIKSDFDREYALVAACPAGTAAMPWGPEAKQWKGDWIDEPGHTACYCSKDAREMSY